MQVLATALAHANTTATNATSLGTILASDKVLVAEAIQFLLGALLGYYGAKALKYILGFIGILALGSALQVWAVGESTSAYVSRVEEGARQAVPLVKKLLVSLGILTVAPVSAGFLVGAVIGLTR